MSTRDELGARMNEVVGQLLRGETPDGFDQLRARHTGRILAMKRVGGMTHVRPDIELLPQWRERAIEFVMATVAGKCSHWDAEMFPEWVRDHPHEGDRDWLALDDVRAGRRRVARIRLKGRSHLVWRRAGQVQAWPSLSST
ncbi:hypothetical protein [Calidifontibacter terrae]